MSTYKPICETYENGTESRPKTPGSPPPVITFTRCRLRTVDSDAYFCANPQCSYYGWLAQGHIRSNAHPDPGSQDWRQFECVSCQRYFYETDGTIFHGKRSPGELIVHVITCLAEELGIRGTARGFEIDPNTVLSGLV